jgi:hypothetical protein
MAVHARTVPRYLVAIQMSCARLRVALPELLRRAKRIAPTIATLGW